MTPSSFDTPRDRVVPTSFEAWRRGERVAVTFDQRTLVVAVKADCFGCRDFVQSDLGLLSGCDVRIISTDEDHAGEWRDAPNEVLRVELPVLKAYDIRWPPFYVLIDHESGQVLTEGVVFGESQVEEETRPWRS